MNMDFKRKLPIPKDIKEMFPISEEYKAKSRSATRRLRQFWTAVTTGF